MSDRMTDATAPTGQCLMKYGRLTRAEMIASYRRHWQYQMEEAKQALSHPDESLRVTTFLGPYAMRNRVEVTD